MKGLFFDMKMWKIILTKMHLAPRFLNYVYKEDWVTPTITRDNEVLVKTVQAGICGSDIHQAKLDMSFYASVLSNPVNPNPIGHEVLGIVEKTHKKSIFQPGDRVVLNPTVHCNSFGFNLCPSCKKGDWEHCYSLVGKGDGTEREKEFQPFRGQMYGGFSEYFIGFEKNLYKVPDKVPNHVAVLIEPFTVALHAVMRNSPSDSDSVIVFGSGTIGLMTIAAIRALGRNSKITCIARYPHQAEYAKQLGADEIMMGIKDSKSLYKRIADNHDSHLVTPLMNKPYVYGAQGPDIIYDTVASESTVTDCFHIIRSGGKIVLIGMSFAITKTVDWAVSIYKEIQVTGSFLQSICEFEGKKVDPYEFGLQYMADNTALFEKFVTHRFPLENYKEAFQTFQNKSTTNAIKVIFDYT